MPEIKETSEIIEAFGAVSVFLAKRFKDGADGEDVQAILEKLATDQEFKAVMQTAYEGRKKVSAELQDLNMIESWDIGKLAVQVTFDLIEALK